MIKIYLHPNDARRHKSPDEIRIMIQQYEQQLDRCSTPQALKLVTAQIKRLKNLINS